MKLHRFDSFNEDRRQLRFPGKDFAAMPHEHVRDALVDLKSMPTAQYYSKISDLGRHISQFMDAAFDMAMKDDNFDEHISMFSYNYGPDENPEYWNQAWLSELMEFEGLESIGDLDDTTVFDAFKNDSPKSVLTEEGLQKFNEYSREVFDGLVEDMTYEVERSFGANEDGLIDIWRSVSYVKKSPAGNHKDIYYAIVKGYRGVGVYWSWDQKKAEAYWGESGGHELILHAMVRPEDVDWTETLFKSAYGLREEREIRVKNGGSVMVVGVEDPKAGKIVELEEPIVVKVGHN